MSYAGRFDGFHAVSASVSKTGLVRFDNTRYSIPACAVGRPVEVRAYADRIELHQNGQFVCAHPRCFGREQTSPDAWHYVPVLARKPGALRNGAPFQNWVLPSGLERVRRKLAGSADGDRQLVRVLVSVLSDGLAAVGQRLLALDRSQCHLGLEARCMGPACSSRLGISCYAAFSPPSGRLSTYRTVQSSPATSVDEVRDAVRRFVARYHAEWLIEKNHCNSPTQARNAWNDAAFRGADYPLPCVQRTGRGRLLVGSGAVW